MKRIFKQYFRTIFISFLAMIILFSCSQNNSNTEVASGKDVSKLAKDYQALQDSVDSAWQTMIKADDQKIRDIKRLLEEVSYTKKYNLFLHDSLMQLQQKIAAKRYTQISMQNSNQIDSYDSATDSLVKGVFRLVKSTPSIDQYPTAINLMGEIIDADNQVVLYRVKYDNWAKTYNGFVQQHKDKLAKKNIGNPMVEKYALFTLNN